MERDIQLLVFRDDRVERDIPEIEVACSSR